MLPLGYGVALGWELYIYHVAELVLSEISDTDSSNIAVKLNTRVTMVWE